MKDNNVCKFITDAAQGELHAVSFIYESKVPKSGERQTMEEYGAYLVAGGDGTYTAASVSRLTPGTLFFSFPDLPFTITSVKNLEYYRICFSGERAGELAMRFGVTPSRCVFSDFEGLIPLWHESLTRADSDTLDLLSESMVLYTFSRLKSASAPAGDAVNAVLARLERGFDDPELTLSAIAEKEGYNEKYLSQAFKKRMGEGFSGYLRTLRMRQAVTLIENGVTSVGNVARLCGYADPLYFSRVFKKQFGVCPREYANSRDPAEK